MWAADAISAPELRERALRSGMSTIMARARSITANARALSPALTLGSRAVVSLIAVTDHKSALTSPAGSPVFPRFQATRQRTEQNRACSRRGANRAPHCSQFRISAIETRYP